MKRKLAISLCILSMCVACGDDDPNPASPGPTDPVAPRNGLVAEYKFSGNANDTGGGANNGTVNGATLTTSRFGGADAAYVFDGVDDVITTTDDHFITGNAVSVSAWFKVNAQPPALRYFIVCSDFGVLANTTSFGVAISIPGTSTASGVVTDLTRWHHLLGTYNGTDIVVYLDGVQADVTNHPGTISDPNYPLVVGAFAGGYFAGAIDDVRIYNRVITDADEIYALYHEGGFGL